jgi:hypothetical protein
MWWKRRSAMKRIWWLAVIAAVLLGLTAAGKPAASAPSNLLVDVSVVPYPEGSPVLVPGDRSDKPSFVVEIWLHHPPTGVAYSHKVFVVFAGEPANGSYSAGDLSVDYRIKVDLKEETAEASVRVSRGKEFVCGAHSLVRLAAPKAGIQPAPGT